LFFSISALLFFLFISVLFKKEGHIHLVIASIATLFYVFAPVMVHRTVAGIPEIESLGMVWFWGAFLFVLLSVKASAIKSRNIYGLLGGIFTGLMIMTWGGFRYIYMALALTFFVVYLFNKEKEKTIIAYSLWLVPSLIFAYFKFSSISSVLFSLSDTAPATFFLAYFLIDNYLIKKHIENKGRFAEKLTRFKIPRELVSLIIIILVALILSLVISPSLIINSISRIFESFIHPFGYDRVGLTVAENKAPYFVEVLGNFGNLFWIFFFGTILIFFLLTNKIKKNRRILVNAAFIITFRKQ